MKLSNATLRKQAGDALRSRILSGLMEPGLVVHLELLAGDLGVSTTPLRAALQDLVKEGLLLKRPGRGFEVATPKPSRPASERATSKVERPIARDTLRDQSTKELRAMILSGVLEPGTILREAALAKKLGISRTPMREALLVLTREGLTSKVTGHGFVVAQLEAEEVYELYSLRAMLEPEALRQSGPPSDDQMKSLVKLNDELRTEPLGPNWVYKDNHWHELLAANNPNRHLRAILERLRKHSLRYELAFLHAVTTPQRSTEQHDSILAQLSAGELELACQTLAANMTVSVAPLLEWLNGPSSDPRGSTDGSA